MSLIIAYTLFFFGLTYYLFRLSEGTTEYVLKTSFYLASLLVLLYSAWNMTFLGYYLGLPALDIALANTAFAIFLFVLFNFGIALIQIMIYFLEYARERVGK